MPISCAVYEIEPIKIETNCSIRIGIQIQFIDEKVRYLHNK